MIDNLSEYFSHRPNRERYQYYMNTSLADKVANIAPHIEKYEGEGKRPLILSIGAGTGKVEAAIGDVIIDSTVVALDASMPMLETIQGQNHEVDADGGHHAVEPVAADAEYLPFGDKSFDAIVLSSIVHEIPSYLHEFDFQATKPFFKECARVLKKGGRIIIRDFMQPENPDEEVLVKIGNAQLPADMDPLLFLKKFSEGFRGDDLAYLRGQLDGVKAGGHVRVKKSHAFELVSHYSWSQSFNEEIAEKYGYLSVKEYTDFVLDAMKETGSNATVVEQKTYLQDGYREHIEGRLDLQDVDGKAIPLPDFTGIIVIEKV